MDLGAAINARMGLNTWAAFYGTDANAEIAGDVAMRSTEITYWAIGPAEKLTNGFKAALDELGKPAHTH
jgi:hypothetical protein